MTVAQYLNKIQKKREKAPEILDLCKKAIELFNGYSISCFNFTTEFRGWPIPIAFFEVKKNDLKVSLTFHCVVAAEIEYPYDNRTQSRYRDYEKYPLNNEGLKQTIQFIRDKTNWEI